MKKFPHIISKLYYEPLLVTRAHHHSICQIVESHVARVQDGEETQLEKPNYTEVEQTAIIPIHGTIVPHASDIPASSCGCGLDDVNAMIDVALSDSNVSTILFDFRTPGGSVTGIPETARKIANITSKKTVAFTDSQCCSGGMWLASQCQAFYSTESASVGSIGVWCAYLDLSRQLENEGVNLQEFSAGKYKTSGAYWKPLTKEEGKIIQASVEKIYGQFKEAIRTRRQVADEFMQGQIFDGLEAVEAGLVDGLVDSIDELL